MAIYREHVLPRIINVACGMKQSNPLRERVCDGLHGGVVEIGFGSGLNVPFYPAAVTGVSAVEAGWEADHRIEDPGRARRARRRVASLRRRNVRHRDLDMDALHDPRRRQGAAGGSARPQARRHPSLRRARPRSGREGPAVAEPAERTADEGVRRLSLEPRDRAAHHRVRLHDQRRRRLLRERCAEGGGRRLARGCGLTVRDSYAAGR